VLGHLRACRDLGVRGTAARSRCAVAGHTAPARAPAQLGIPAAPPTPPLSPCSAPRRRSGRPLIRRRAGRLGTSGRSGPERRALHWCRSSRCCRRSRRSRRERPANTVQNAQQLEQTNAHQNAMQTGTGTATDEQDQTEPALALLARPW